MKKKKVKEFKPYNSPLIVHPEMIIEDMLKLFLKHPNKHHLCVVDENNKLIGLISRKRIFRSIKSSIEGFVKKIFVAPGDLVDSDKLLIELGRDE